MNLPNKLTLFRMLLVPLMVVFYLFPYSWFQIEPIVFHLGTVEFSLMKLLVLCVFVIASLTDYFDGQIARGEGIVTTFGKFMDPIADKLLVNTMIILLASDGSIPILATILMISRDTFVDGIRLVALANQEVIAAGKLGKLKTVLQMTAIIMVLLDNFPFSYIHLPIDQCLIWLATLVSVISGIDYFMHSKHLILESI